MNHSNVRRELFFRRPLIFLATVLLFTVDYRLQCIDNASDKGRICTVYIRCSDLFLSLHRTLRYEIIICHDNENERQVVLLSIFCRAIRENQRLCIVDALTRERSRIKGEFNTPTSILWNNSKSEVCSRVAILFQLGDHRE